MGRKLELGNSAIMTELAHQGATLVELSRALRKVSTQQGDAKVLSSDAGISAGEELEANPIVNRARAMSFPSATQSSNPDFLEAHTRRKSPVTMDVVNPDSSIPRSRMSWASKLRESPLSFVSRLPPWTSSQTRDERGDEPQCPSGISHSPSSPPPAYRELDDNIVTKSDSNTTEEALPDRKRAPARRPTNTDKPLPTAPSRSHARGERLGVSNQHLVGNSISPNTNGSGLLIEMLMPSESTCFNEAVPFAKFGESKLHNESSSSDDLFSLVPLTSDRLEFVKKQLDGIRNIILPLLTEPDKIKRRQLILLCPEDTKAKPLLVKKKHAVSQNEVQAYILPKPVIIVSVRFLRQRSWYFIGMF